MKKWIFSFLTLLLLGCAIPTWAGNISGTITVQGGGAWPDGLWLALGKIDNNVIVGATNVSGGTYSFSVPYDNISVNFYLSTDGEWPTWSPSSDWVFVDGGQNPYTYDYTSGDVTLNLVIKPAGGGGDDTPKASLVGKVLDGAVTNTSCMTGVKVALSKEGYSAETTTEYQNNFYDLLTCPYGYEFKNLELGTYTLTYSKYNYITQTQTVTIEEAGQTVAPAVTLQAAPSEYMFYGNIKYLDADNQEVKVEGAKITAYDGPGEDALRLAEPVYTDADGAWTMTLECKANATVYFFAEHPNIEVNGRTSRTAQSTSGNFVEIFCTEKVPDLLGFETYKVKQVTVKVNGENRPGAEISWTWPQALIDNYKTSETEGDYKITSVKILRPVGMEGLTAVGEIVPAEFELPATSFIDGKNLTYALEAGKTYKYTVEIAYSYPKLGNVRMANDERLTITLQSGLVEPDSVTLTLDVNDATMGTVTGTGKYEKGDQIMIRAKANKGYLFKEWQKDGVTYATEAEYKLTLTADMTLTAVFEERPAIHDSVTIALVANDDKMGSVTGDGRYPKGEEVTIEATPKAGYTFKQWKSGNTVLSAKKVYTFVANTDSTITAVFQREIVYRAMTNCRAKQISETSVRLDWEWPQELKDDYKSADGTGIYEISTIAIMRRVEGQTTNPDQVGTLRPLANTLPATYFVNESTENRPLEIGATYNYFIEVHYSAPAFQTVTVNNDGSNPNLSVTMVRDVEPVQFYTLSLSVNSSEMGIVEGMGQYQEGDEVTATGIAKPGYVFQCWKEGDEVVSTAAAYTFTMPGHNRSLVAEFIAKATAPKVTLTLTVNSEMGEVTVTGNGEGNGEYIVGTQVTVTAVANEGYVFQCWKENDEVISYDAEYTFTIEADRALEAVFVSKSTGENFTITLEVNDETMGTVTGAGEYAVGEQVTVTATPNEGYFFSGWMEDGQMLNAAATYQFIANRSRTLRAVFTDSVDITLQVNNTARGTVTGSGKYKKGTEVTVKAIPTTG